MPPFREWRGAHSRGALNKKLLLKGGCSFERGSLSRGDAHLIKYGIYVWCPTIVSQDSFRCHLTPAVKNLLNKGKIDTAILPGGCMKYIQAPDVSWNKPMKDYLRDMYDLWLANESHEVTVYGNMTQLDEVGSDPFDIEVS